MRYLLLALLLFAALPYDAQLAALTPLRWIWLSEAGRSLVLGGIGALVVSMFVYSAGWNALAEQVYREDVGRAEEARRRRMR